MVGRSRGRKRCRLSDRSGGNPSLPACSDFISVTQMNAYTPRSALFAAAVHFLPHVAPKSLGQLDEAEERAALSHAIRLANGLAKQLSVGGWTVAPLPSLKKVLEQASPKSSVRPEWIRMPKKGRCPYCGLSRSSLWLMVSPNAANGYRPPVQSVVLRKEGNTRGARLIHYESLMAHIASMRFDPPDTEPTV